MENATPKFLTAKQVRIRFGGVSEMTLWRWERDPKLSFPQPLKINRLRYFREAEIETFEAQQAKRAS